MVGGDAGKEKDQGTVADMSHVWGSGGAGLLRLSSFRGGSLCAF